MKAKKVLSLLLAGAMVFSLAACGGKTEQGKKEDSAAVGKVEAEKQGGETGNKEVTLSVSIWDSNQQAGLQEIMDDFTAKSGIKANISVVGWDDYWTTLAAGAQGGALPDVFWMHSNESQRYMSNNMLLDLTDKIASSELVKKENYPADIWSLYEHENKSYAVPKDVDTIALWYNKKLFDEAKVDYPTADWTWEDMFAAAKKLTKEDGSQHGLAIRNDNNQAGYYNIIYSNDGTILSEDKKKSGWDDPKTVQAMELLEGAIKDGSMPSLETMSENKEEVLFSSGKVAMVLQGSWMLAYYKGNEYTAENCDCVELPKSSVTGRRVSIYNGLGWAAAANGEHTEEAWKLIEYLGSKEAQEKQAKLGVTMSAYNGTSEAWTNAAQFNLKGYLNMMNDMVIRPFSKNTVTWENSDNEILQSVYQGKKTMAEACKEMAEKMNEVLAEE